MKLLLFITKLKNFPELLNSAFLAQSLIFLFLLEPMLYCNFHRLGRGEEDSCAVRRFDTLIKKSSKQ